MRRVVSVIQKSIDAEMIVIRSEDGYDQQYEARPLVQARVKMRSIGDAAVLLLCGKAKWGCCFSVRHKVGASKASCAAARSRRAAGVEVGSAGVDACRAHRSVRVVP